MARNLFDLINAHNQRSGGYAPFDPRIIDPIQASNLRARENLMSQRGTGPALAGNVLGAALGGLIGRGVDKYRANKPENKLKASLGGAINSALTEKIAKNMKQGNMSPREAVAAAAEELYASTAGSKQDPAFRDMIRSTAMGKLIELGEFDPEAQEKFAKAKKDLADANAPADLGDVENYLLPSGEVVSVPGNIAERILANDPRAMKKVSVEGTGELKPGDVLDRAYVGDKVITRTYDPTGELTGKTPNAGGIVTEIGDARAAAGGDEADPRTDSQQGAALEAVQSKLTALESINEAINSIESSIDKAADSGVPGVTGKVGGAYKFFGEATSIVKAAAQFSRQQFGNNTKVYDNGRQTFSELTEVSKYEKEFSHFQEGANLSNQAKASLINLAYLLAISQEASARAISDKDIALRLQTIGGDISDGRTVKEILESRRGEAFAHLESQLNNDFNFSSGESPEAKFVWKRFDAIKGKYLKPSEQTTKQSGPGRQPSGAKLHIGADGTVTFK